VARRERIRAYGAAAALALLGGILGFVIPGLVGQIVRLSLITLAMGAVLLLVFYEIGLSEDKARAREEEERREQQGREHPDSERHRWTSGRPRRPG
jgi:uncharacterized membrane protein YjfL (UPF0719 family)